MEDVVVWSPGPLRLATDNPSVIHRCRGGSAANVAEFAAGLVSTRFIGRVGDDPLGASLCGQLTAAGVDVRVQRVGRTGCIVVVVDVDGERTMFPDRGASAELRDVPEEWINGISGLHLTAYTIATADSEKTAVALLSSARARGAVTSVDASSTTTLREYGVDRFRELVRDLRPSILFANADEARLLDLHASDATPETTVVIKDGARPTTVIDARGTTRTPVPPIPEIRDTTGAGDAFAAGYLAAVLGGAPSEEAVAGAHRLAAQVLATPGAQTAAPTTREVM
ncbi:carbohydrate kinase family protein [Spiractinospora alimapuensis]|nr:carbohydrate kinase family protein [Spiractinospora alimapuensis]